MEKVYGSKNVVLLVFKLLLFSYLAYLTWFLATGYHPVFSSYHPPFSIFVIDTINLFIHEAGHFFFKIFGRFMYMLGGSLFQVLLPLTLLIVTWRQDVIQIPYSGFWVGESMINVSIYIQDAPFKQLRLINPHLIHDWNWLLSNHLGLAETLGDIVFVIGLMVCIGAVVVGCVFAVVSFRNTPQVKQSLTDSWGD